MLIRDRRIYHAQAALLGCTAAGTLWTLLGPAGLALGLAIAGAGFVVAERAWRAREREPDNRFAEGVAAGGLVAAAFGFLLGDLLVALILLLLGAQLAAMALMREHRQLPIGWMAAFVVLMAGATQAIDDAYLAVFALFALCLVLGLGYAWLDRHHHAGGRARWSVASQWRVLASWLLVAFVLYLVTPRLDPLLIGSHGTFGGPGYFSDEWERRASDIDEATPDDLRRGDDGRGRSASTSGDEADRARADGYQGFDENSFDISRPDPGDARVSNVEVLSLQAQRGGYLRVRVFDRFDGLRWHNTLRGERIWRGDGGWYRFVDEQRDATNYAQSIEVLAPLGPAIPAAAPAINIYFPAAVLKRTEYGTFEAPSGLERGTYYSVDSQLDIRDGRLFDRFSPAPRDADYALPPGLDPRIGELAGAVSAGARSPLERALALEEHLRTGYAYSLESVFTSQDRTPLAQFLFETRRGHCEFFASALAVMLRTQGVATRLATGYSATHYNPITGRYEIRVLDGHAWVEAWINGGWVLLEPTPFYTLSPPTEGRLTAEQIETYLQRLREIDEALGETRAHDLDPERLLLGFWQAVIEAANVLIAAVAWLLLALWPLWLALLVAGFLAWLAWRYRRDALLDRFADARVRSYRFAGGAEDFHFVFGQAQRRLARRGRERRAGQALEAYCSHLHAEGVLSHPHRALCAAAHACFVEARDWDPRWRALLLAFYADVRGRAGE